MGDATSIGSRVRRARLYRQLTLAELSGLIGRSKGWLSMVENGHIRLDKRSDIALLADVLDVSAADLLGDPSPAIPVQGPGYGDPVHLREVLLEGSLDDPVPIDPRPVEAVQIDYTERLEPARRASDYRTVCQILPDLLAETHVHAHQSDAALRLLVELCVCGTFTLGHLGQRDLAWIAAERAQQAAQRLDEPTSLASAAFASAHARPAATRSRALLRTAQTADELRPHAIGTRTQQIYGMLLLSAGLAHQVSNHYATAQECLAEAEEVAERIGEQSDAWQRFGPANVAAWHTTIATEAGEPDRALAYSNSVQREALSRGRRATLSIDRGRAQMMLGRPQAAAREIRSAERLSPARVHSNPMVHELVRGIVEAPLKDSVLRGLAWRLGIIE